MTAKDKQEAWDKQETYAGKPHGWVQWKGTNVCMDVHCKCGHHSHIDAEFAYFVECPKCGTIYFTNGHVQLVELADATNLGHKPVVDADEKQFFKDFPEAEDYDG